MTDSCSERHSEKAQEEFREEAKALLKTVLEKNDEVDDLRRVRFQLAANSISNV